MKLEVWEEAVEDLKEMDEGIREQIRDRLEGLKENPLGENTSLFRKQGLDLFRLKLKNEDLDHRIFYDINDRTIEIYGVIHKNHAYTKESIQKIKSRT